MDSGAFTRITSGKGHLPVERYVDLAERWSSNGPMVAVVSQDWMTETPALRVTGLSVREHQLLTTRRLVALRDRSPGLPWMAVVQGRTPDEYRRHASEIAGELPADAWVGVGSICKRQGRPDEIRAVLESVLDAAPGWRLHGFGVKSTTLRDRPTSALLFSVDSMAWSFEARWARLRDRTLPHANSLEACLGWLERLDRVRSA